MTYSIQDITEDEIEHIVKSKDYYCAIFDIWNAMFKDFEEVEQLKKEISEIFYNYNIEF